MPKVTYCNVDALGKAKPAQKSSQKPSQTTRNTPGKKVLENSIIDRFGMSLTLADLCVVLGLRDPKCARNWISKEGIQAVEINGRKRYLATDVASILDRSKLRAV